MTTNAQDIQSAKRTIDKEIEALRMMEDQLDDSLCKALDVMQKTTGRVIITGMGKSGHIGSKIAATLASTGTPSFFVHPGEASHGDLGMLTASDSVVAISNSGETKELSDIIIYCKRYGIPLIAITKILTAPSAVPETFSSSCRMTAKPVPWAWLRHRRQRQPWCWEIFSPFVCWSAKASPKPTSDKDIPAASSVPFCKRFPTLCIPETTCPWSAKKLPCRMLC